MANTSYDEFNRFQSSFYTNIRVFNEFTNFDFKRHGFVLISNLAKGFPNLADLVANLNGIGWKGTESPAILKSLQRNFVNNFNATQIPQFIYYKSEKVVKSKEKSKETSKGLIFDSEIQSEIQSILFIDSKTYEYLRFGPKIQFLGQQLCGEFMQKTKIKTSKKK